MLVRRERQFNLWCSWRVMQLLFHWWVRARFFAFNCFCFVGLWCQSDGHTNEGTRITRTERERESREFAYSFTPKLKLNVGTDVFTDVAEMLTLDGASNVNCSSLSSLPYHSIFLIFFSFASSLQSCSTTLALSLMRVVKRKNSWHGYTSVNEWM